MIRKRISKKIDSLLKKEEIIVVEGGHKVGKTYLLNKYKKKLDKRNLNNILIDIKKEKYSKKLTDANRFTEYVNSRFNSKKEKIYLFLDGIQQLENPSDFLVKISKQDNFKIFATASSAIYRRSKNFKENKDKFNIFTIYSLSWKEFLYENSQVDFNGVYKNIEELKKFYKNNSTLLEDNFPDLIRWGSYPSVTNKNEEKEKNKEIEKILHTTIEEEVAHKIQKRHMSVYLKFLQILAKNISNSLNYNKISNQLDIHKRTLNKFVDITRDHFLFSFVDPYYTDPSNEISKMTKIYCNDFGILNYLAGKNSMPRLPIVYEKEEIENFIFNELCRHEDISFVYFYRTIAKAEIDFIGKTEKGIIPIELNFQENKKKKSVALKNFNERYKDSVIKTIVITKNKLSIQDETIYLPAVLLPFTKLI